MTNIIVEERCPQSQMSNEMRKKPTAAKIPQRVRIFRVPRNFWIAVFAFDIFSSAMFSSSNDCERLLIRKTKLRYICIIDSIINVKFCQYSYVLNYCWSNLTHCHSNSIKNPVEPLLGTGFSRGSGSWTFFKLSVVVTDTTACFTRLDEVAALGAAIPKQSGFAWLILWLESVDVGDDTPARIEQNKCLPAQVSRKILEQFVSFSWSRRKRHHATLSCHLFDLQVIEIERME
jgi:hypothetical protein